MRTIIIEDEVAATNLLSNILKEYCLDVEIVGNATTVSSGIDLIKESKPELVFLDLKLQDELSFEILDRIKDQNFYLIITTAYDAFAVKAFKYDAVDYILKPYVPKEIIAAVHKVLKREESESTFKKLSSILEKSQKKQRISLATNEGIRLCNQDEIFRIEASGSYCKVYTRDENLMISKPLAEIERMLSKELFIRVHNSHSVNKKYVKGLKNADGGFIEMKDGSQVPIARRRKQNFLNQII